MLRRVVVFVVVLWSVVAAAPAGAQPEVPTEDVLMFVDWWVQSQPDYLRTVEGALEQFTDFVEENEPGTRIYLVYTPRVPSQPPAGTNLIFFVENYRDSAAFDLHLANFDAHVSNRFGGLFVAAPNSALDPFIEVENAARYRPAPGQPPAGYIRPDGPRRAAITQVVKWWLKPTADRAAVLRSLAEFAAWCEENEPGTVIYLFSLPEAGNTWPPANPGEITFMAGYVSQEAFDLHVANWDERFLAPHADDFVASPDGGYPFIQVLDLELFDGFVRPEVTTAARPPR